MRWGALGLEIAVLLLALMSSGCSPNGEATVEAAPTVESRVTTVRTVVLRPEEITDMVVLSADLLPMRRATLAAEVSGVVEELGVEMGDRVRKGQVLARIDTRDLRQQLAEAEALFRQAQDRFERAEKLFEKRSITQERHLDAVASRDVAEARLGSARLALDKSEVRAPWAGRVADRKTEVGDYAAPGQPLVELVAVDRLKVQAPVSAADVLFLKVGVPVEVRVDGLPGEVFDGEVVRLGAELDPRTRTLDLEAEIDNHAGRLRPGMFGRMMVPRRVLADAILVPLVAVVDFERQKVVYVVEGEIAKRRVVELGPVIDDRVVIRSGLASGEQVVMVGQQQVADGQPVTAQQVD